jgi:hypothetical protein
MSIMERINDLHKNTNTNNLKMRKYGIFPHLETVHLSKESQKSTAKFLIITTPSTSFPIPHSKTILVFHAIYKKTQNPE